MKYFSTILSFVVFGLVLSSVAGLKLESQTARTLQTPFDKQAFFLGKMEHFNTLVEVSAPQCTSYFTRANIDLASQSDFISSWLVQNCRIFSPALGTYYNAADLNWNTPDSQAFFNDPWMCADSSSWALYYPANCSWVVGEFENGCNAVQTSGNGDSETSIIENSEAPTAAKEPINQYLILPPEDTTSSQTSCQSQQHTAQTAQYYETVGTPVYAETTTVYSPEALTGVPPSTFYTGIRVPAYNQEQEVAAVEHTNVETFYVTETQFSTETATTVYPSYTYNTYIVYPNIAENVEHSAETTVETITNGEVFNRDRSVATWDYTIPVTVEQQEVEFNTAVAVYTTKTAVNVINHDITEFEQEHPGAEVSVDQETIVEVIVTEKIVHTNGEVEIITTTNDETTDVKITNGGTTNVVSTSSESSVSNGVVLTENVITQDTQTSQDGQIVTKTTVSVTEDGETVTSVVVETTNSSPSNGEQEVEAITFEVVTEHTYPTVHVEQENPIYDIYTVEQWARDSNPTVDVEHENPTAVFVEASVIESEQSENGQHTVHINNQEAYYPTFHVVEIENPTDVYVATTVVEEALVEHWVETSSATVHTVAQENYYSTIHVIEQENPTYNAEHTEQWSSQTQIVQWNTGYNYYTSQVEGEEHTFQSTVVEASVEQWSPYLHPTFVTEHENPTVVYVEAPEVESEQSNNGPQTVAIIEHENYYPTIEVVEQEIPENDVYTAYTTQTMIDYWGPARKVASWVTYYTYNTAAVENQVEGVTGTPYTYQSETTSVYVPTSYTVEHVEGQTSHTYQYETVSVYVPTGYTVEHVEAQTPYTYQYETVSVYVPTGYTVEHAEAQTQHTPTVYTGRIVVLPTNAQTNGTPRTVVNPTWVPTKSTGQVVIVENNVETTTQAEQTEIEVNIQNTNTNNTNTNISESSWTSSDENHGDIIIPSSNPTSPTSPASQPGCTSNGQVSLGPDDKRGSSSFYYKSSNGDVVYNYQYVYNSIGETVSEEDVINYDYSYVDEKVNSSISSISSFTEGDETVIQGCSGWWDDENIDLTNPNCEDADWFLQNCVVTDPLTKIQYAASEVNFSTLRGQSLLYSNWKCSSGNSQWQFDFEQCQWENVQGTQSLVEVRNLHKASSLNKPQLTLGF